MAPPSPDPGSGASFTAPPPRSPPPRAPAGAAGGSRTLVETAACPPELRRGPDGW
jgi:hypothetical protein